MDTRTSAREKPEKASRIHPAEAERLRHCANLIFENGAEMLLPPDITHLRFTCSPGANAAVRHTNPDRDP